MTEKEIPPALSAAEWKEWRAYKAGLARTRTNPERDALIALQTMARNNDLLPDDSPYKVTHNTVADLYSAAECLESEGKSKEANATRRIARTLAASLGPE